ncbi:MAG: IS1595 family transposase [Hyphomonadaceae bacterium]|nr:MAG: ISSpo3 transposase [Caulobacteraceae bacterium]MBT9444461.1 IS1595 family transposase [Hyphomonadaceae bacterium]TPW07106.1 MAG: ISSpo3, transposase [Alphaproteobacteria bacterium]
MTKPKPPTFSEFGKRFPTEEACLEHLMRTRWGQKHPCVKCGREAKYYRVKGRRSYECEFCGHQVYPTAGTPFENTRTPLKSWFLVMFMFCTSRNGVSAKEVQRTLGVTYKTAWRMCNLIRQYMGYVDGDGPVGGPDGDRGAVEIDEAFLGGYDPRPGPGDKKAVLGMVERGGEVVAVYAPDRRSAAVMKTIRWNVAPCSTIYTDEAGVFGGIGFTDMRYTHSTINHAKKEWVRGDTHTNTIESFWANLKRGINGTYIHVSSQHLQKYLWEFEYRHNMRHSPHLMLDTLLLAFPRP